LPTSMVMWDIFSRGRDSCHHCNWKTRRYFKGSRRSRDSRRKVLRLFMFLRKYFNACGSRLFGCVY
jgi:hypothetical protein